MMNGRGYNVSGYSDHARNFEYGFMNNGWCILMAVGVILAITFLVYMFVHNKKKKVSNNSLVEVLKMKYVQGEISEEEYLQRREVIGRK